MLRGMVDALGAALRSERGFLGLGAVAGVAETGGGFIGSIGSLFGGGKDGVFNGVEYHTGGGFDPAGLSAAWNNAPATARQSFISTVVATGASTSTTPGSTAWLGVVNRWANGGHDGKPNAAESAVRRAAETFVMRWANVGASGVGATSTIPVQPAGGTPSKPSIGERVDQIIGGIEGRPQQEIAVEPAKPLTAGFDLSNPVVLVALGGAAFLLFQAATD